MLLFWLGSSSVNVSPHCFQAGLIIGSVGTFSEPDVILPGNLLAAGELYRLIGARLETHARAREAQFGPFLPAFCL